MVIKKKKKIHKKYKHNIYTKIYTKKHQQKKQKHTVVEAIAIMKYQQLVILYSWTRSKKQQILKLYTEILGISIQGDFAEKVRKLRTLLHAFRFNFEESEARDSMVSRVTPKKSSKISSSLLLLFGVETRGKPPANSQKFEK